MSMPCLCVWVWVCVQCSAFVFVCLSLWACGVVCVRRASCMRCVVICTGIRNRGVVVVDSRCGFWVRSNSEAKTVVFRLHIECWSLSSSQMRPTGG
jgi:hypothetical protein